MALSSACVASAPSTAAVDGGPEPVDARDAIDCAVDGCPPPCDDLLEIGLCRLASGGPCRGSLYAATEFVEVTDGASVAVIVGEQGSRMIGLAARTRGIAPGDPMRPSDTDNPALEVRVVDGTGSLVAVYRGRVAFVPDASDPTLLVCSAIDVVTDFDLSGPLAVTATLRDRDGVTRCGRRRLTIAP